MESEKLFRIKILPILITSVLINSLVIAFLIADIPSDGNSPEQNITARISYTTHATIKIIGNAGFLGPNVTTGISTGNGTADDPFIIEGWDIDASSTCGILIQNTTAFFVVRDSYVRNGEALTYGILLRNVTNGTISNTTCWDNAMGLYLDMSYRNTIVNFTCSSNTWVGIYLYQSYDNTILNSTCIGDPPLGARLGISIQDSRNILLRGNSMTDCGLELTGSSLSQWTTQSIDASNSVNGKPIYYCLNQTGGTVPLGAGQVIIANCSDMIVRDQMCSNGGIGISVAWSSNITVMDNICSFDSEGIRIDFTCHEIMIVNNTCSYNTNRGIFISGSSNSVTDNTCSFNFVGIYFSGANSNGIKNNTLLSNSWGGILLYSSKFNNITGNILSYNAHYGIDTGDATSASNSIWNNTFTGNNGGGIQAIDDGGSNRWNLSGPNGIGNNWSDWRLPDDNWDGVVDSPYSISGSAGAKDYYPLSSHFDNIAPITAASSSGTIGTNGWFKSDVSVSLSATDAGSGVNATFYRIGTSGGWLNYSAPFILSSDGNYTVQFYSMDNASNNETVKNVTVKIDQTISATFSDISGILSPNMWYNSTATVTLTPSDSYSGINYTEYRIDGGAWLAYTIPFTLGAEGHHTVEFFSVDKAGNIETTRSVNVDIDKTDPETVSGLSGTHKPTEWYTSVVNWYISVVTVTLKATDNVGGSGVNATFYRIGTSDGWLNYSAPFILSSEGISTVQFYSVDNAGNNESMNSIIVKIDKTSPTLTINRTSGFTSTVDYVIISWISFDAASGISHFEISIDGGAFVSVDLATSHNFTGLADGMHNVTVKAVDVAGNEFNIGLYFTVDTSASRAGTLGDLMLYGAITAIIVVIIVAVLVIMMRKKKKP